VLPNCQVRSWPRLAPPPSIGQSLSDLNEMLAGRSFRTLHRLFSTSPCRMADPWPLPHTKQHMETTAIPPNIPKPIPVPRHNESLETLRARLTYQTRKRGTLESDLIMSTFAKDHLHSLTQHELLELDQVTYPETYLSRLSIDWVPSQLLDEPDWDVYYWCTEGKAPPERWVNSPILGKLKTHARNEGKVVRRMPDLNPPQRSS
jgi:succinate dehydrogenase assembly factor 2